LEWTIFGVVEIDGRPGVACLHKTALEYLHDAMCVRMAASRQYSSRLRIVVCGNQAAESSIFDGTAARRGQYRKLASLPCLLR
jgi:hypothetical protein